MAELKDALERESEGFELTPGALDRLLARRSARLRRKRVGAALLALLVAGAGAWGAIRATSSLRPEKPRPATPGSKIAKVTATIVVGPGGDQAGLAFEDGSLWVGHLSKPEVTRVDARTNRIVGRIRVGEGPKTPPDPDSHGGGPRGLASGFGSVWAVSDDLGAVFRIDPVEGRVVARIEVGFHPNSLVAGFGAVWVRNTGDGSISRIDPSTNRVVATIRIPGEVGRAPAPAVGAGSVWAADDTAGVVYRIDPATNEISARIPGVPAPGAVAASDHSVWVLSTGNPSITRIDPTTNAMVDAIHTQGIPSALAVEDGVLWVLSTSAQTLSALDARDGRRLATVPVGVGASYATAAGSTVWVSNLSAGTVTRVELRT